MAMYRKLGKKSDQRIALLRNQVTQLLYHGKIETTEARAKEVRKIAEHLITLAVKEKDNFDEIKVTAKVAKKDKDGKRIKEVVDGKKVTQYDEVEKTVRNCTSTFIYFFSFDKKIGISTIRCRLRYPFGFGFRM